MHIAIGSMPAPNRAPPTSALTVTLRRRSKRVICADPLPISSCATVSSGTLRPSAFGTRGCLASSDNAARTSLIVFLSAESLTH
jgi:hypothetical protein